MAASHYQYQTALMALRLTDGATDARDLLAWALIADYLGITCTPGYMRCVAGLVAEHRGDVGDQICTMSDVIACGMAWPGEHAQLTGWGTKGRCPRTGQPLNYWNRSRSHCLALILAHLMGMPVSHDAWWACDSYEVASNLSEESKPTDSPYPMSDDKRIKIIKRPRA